ncbi:MAG TPA: type II toxin-antitoxin system RelE/ParE family toxin [Chitinophagales bacterium]|mgnify:CR=1 FL=1|jgi:plasmid stabilization system protein ParE|nr:type II toxin-antitoxin system RelE/ParE family toxin [Chitinophagales bacterium]HPN19745.1 type II toxin-antitoxin system RelE/ParE family toxin [Chitinophagales bacterium]
MMLNIFVTERAEESLSEIIDFYLSKYTIERTKKILDSIDDAFVKIAKSPFHFPVCFDIRTPQTNTRQFLLHNTFKIIYRIQPNTIEIIEIFHGKRNPEIIKDVD